MKKADVSIFNLGMGEDFPRQVHPKRGERLSPEEVSRLRSGVHVLLRPCGGGQLKLTSSRYQNITVKMPSAPHEDLNQRIETSVSRWFPGEEVIIVLVESSSSHP